MSDKTDTLKDATVKRYFYDTHNQLRAVVDNEALSIEERKDAAGLIVTLAVEAVTDPTDDHPEVVELCKPFAGTEDDKFISEIVAKVGGRPMEGWSLTEAKSQVLKRNRERAVLALVVDETAPKLIRLAACQTVLDSFTNPNSKRLKAGMEYTAERLLSEIKPAKWSSRTMQYVPVCRPPQSQADVW